ncbi:hypothetical protein BTUL_0080g00400 [Botrytis tulipae]|uniref:Uncharacterized protein n=1 Tax=Botrytis tulipae TaxID=87230 RepID=A0A4Z1EMW7_9HELO|nr:hypothetical protein BTUL_0080g00400 [Botrytis tulipae]
MVITSEVSCPFLEIDKYTEYPIKLTERIQQCERDIMIICYLDGKESIDTSVEDAIKKDNGGDDDDDDDTDDDTDTDTDKNDFGVDFTEKLI